MLDGLTHRVHILEMNGESYRLATSKKTQRQSQNPKTPSEGDPATELYKSARKHENIPGLHSPFLLIRLIHFHAAAWQKLQLTPGFLFGKCTASVAGNRTSPDQMFKGGPHGRRSARGSHGPRMQPKAGRMTEHKPAIEEVHILWITGGLGCDGDSVSITAATQPSLEDVMLGTIPGLPKVHLHNPVLAYTVGDEFMAPFHKAARGELDNFVLVMEGSIPNEKISGDGYWAAYGTDPQTGNPITIPEWLDRLTPKALAVVTAGTCAAFGGIHAMKGNPTGCMGVADYLGWDWKSKAGLPTFQDKYQDF